jgi:hypothetical protein
MKKLTPLAQSIERKKERLHKLNTEPYMRLGCQRTEAWTLETEIAEDEKLRKEERQNLIEAYNKGQQSGIDADQQNWEASPPEDWFNETYEQ